MPLLNVARLQDRPKPEAPECPVCGLSEADWGHEACDEAQQVEPYRP